MTFKEDIRAIKCRIVGAETQLQLDEYLSPPALVRRHRSNLEAALTRRLRLEDHDEAKDVFHRGRNMKPPSHEREQTGLPMQSEVAGTQRTSAQLAAIGADAGQVADAAVSTWRDIDAALSPIIGKRGVAALYKRSVHLTRAAHPALAAVQEGALQSDEFASLRVVLSQQTGADAAVTNAALLQTFTDLLTRLIGTSLNERLLRPVWHHLSSGGAAQDTSK